MVGRFLAYVRRGGVRLLAIALIIGAVITVAALPVAVHYGAQHNHWTAIAAVSGVGALAFAFTATFVAVIAYDGSTQRPVLGIGVEPSSARYQGGYYRFQLSVVLSNRGTVAARFIAVRVTIDGAVFEQASVEWRILADRVAQWDGGADAIIHPGWNATIKPLFAAINPPLKAEHFTVRVEVVADRAGTVSVPPETVDIIRS